jgi:hypothetical protein
LQKPVFSQKWQFSSKKRHFPLQFLIFAHDMAVLLKKSAFFLSNINVFPKSDVFPHKWHFFSRNSIFLSKTTFFLQRL